MFTIQLKKLLFYSFHGIHAEEKILGGNFEVNIDVGFAEPGRIDSLKQTIDYVSLYSIVKEEMQKPAELLETLAQDIAHRMHAFDNCILSVTVSVEKMNPPITGMEGKIAVKYQKNF